MIIFQKNLALLHDFLGLNRVFSFFFKFSESGKWRTSLDSFDKIFSFLIAPEVCK